MLIFSSSKPEHLSGLKLQGYRQPLSDFSRRPFCYIFKAALPYKTSYTLSFLWFFDFRISLQSIRYFGRTILSCETMSDPGVRAKTITMQAGNTPPSARPNLDIDSSKILGNIHKQSLDSDISVETQAKDVVSSVPHSGLNDQSSLGLEKGMKASDDGSQPENQKAAIKSNPVLTGEVLSTARSQNANSSKPMTDLQSSPRTIGNMWNVLIEVKSSVEHILFGMANLTHQVKAGDPVRFSFFFFRNDLSPFLHQCIPCAHSSRSSSPPATLRSCPSSPVNLMEWK